jgi:hypothetical protein
MELEKMRLLDTDPFIIIEYVKSSIEILINLKKEEQGTDETIKKMLPSVLYEPTNPTEAGLNILKNAAEITWSS